MTKTQWLVSNRHQERMASNRLRYRILMRLIHKFLVASVAVFLLGAGCNSLFAQRASFAPSPVRPVSYETVPTADGVAMSYENMGASSSCNCGNCESHAPGRCPPNRQPPVALCPPQQPTGIINGERPICITGVDSAWLPNGEKHWSDAQPLDFQPLWHGEYIGPVRLPSMLEYRIRVNDEIQLTYLRTRQKLDQDYRLMVGDEIAISSLTDESLRLPRVQIMADGNILVGYLGSVSAAGKTFDQLRKDLERAAMPYVKSPAISLEPVKLDTAIDDLRAAVNNQFAAGGPTTTNVVNPDGRIQVIGIGAFNVLGMTTEEVKREINLRYRDRFPGMEVEPRLSRLAPHGFYVFGEVNKPGRQEAIAPITVLQALSNADPKITANLRQVVIQRRAEDWRVISTMLDLRGAQLGKRPTPSDEIWLRDNDLIIVPPRPVSRFDNFARLVFSDGIYRIIPFQGVSIQSQR